MEYRMEFVNPIFNCFIKNIMLYISIQRFYVTSTQKSINGTLCVYCVLKHILKESFRICLIKEWWNQLFLEIKMFTLLPQIYPRDFVDYFVRNYFRFLDDIFHTWLINFDIEPFYKLINELDADLITDNKNCHSKSRL